MPTLITPLLKAHINIFQAIGYCNLSFDKNNNNTLKNSTWLKAWTWVLMVSFNCTAFVILFYKKTFLYTADSFGNFNDIFKVILADIAITSAYLETTLRSECLIKFWILYERLQKRETVSIPKSWLQQAWQHKRFLAIFYVLLVTEILVMLAFIKFQEKTKMVVLFWCVFSPVIYTVHMRNIQFIFHVELLRLELVRLNEDLQLLADYSRFMANGAGFRGFEKFLLRKLKEKQQIYQWIYEMFEQFQQAFGFSILTVFLMIAVRVLVDIYFGYYFLYRFWHRNNGAKYGNIISQTSILESSLTVPACMQLVFFLISSKNCMEVLQQITRNLHSIISQFKGQDIEVSVQVCGLMIFCNY